MRRLGPHHWRAVALSALLAAALVVALGSGVALLLAPALALPLLLAHGVFPGEQAMERLRTRRRRPREHRAPRNVTAHRVVVVRRTAWLAASPLAMRPPPVSLPAISY